MRPIETGQVVETAPGEFTVTAPCTFTGKPYSVKVSKSELDAYNSGGFVQDAFPRLSVDDHEFLISGISPAGWGTVFPGGDPEC